MIYGNDNIKTFAEESIKAQSADTFQNLYKTERAISQQLKANLDNAQTERNQYRKVLLEIHDKIREIMGWSKN